MNNAWPRVQLGSVLRRSDETVIPIRGSEYREVTVRLWGKGVIERGRVNGATVSARRFVARSGQLILSRIDARNGAIGLVSQALDGALVTNDFPLFNIDHDYLDPIYLEWISKTPWFVEQCLKASEGTTNRVRLKEERFARIEIPLPPMVVQQRVVEQIEAVRTLIQEAQKFRQDCLDLGTALLQSFFTQNATDVLTPMASLVSLRKPDINVEANSVYDFAGIYSFGRGMFRSGQKSGMEFAYQRLTRVHTGDFVYPKLMAWEGALAVVPPECDGCVVSPEFPVFEVNEELVFPEVLDVYFRNPSVWPQLSEASTGTNVRRRRLNPQDFLAYEMPLPSRTTQLKLRAVYAEVAKLKELQAQTSAELDALMPSVLSKAFAGEL